MIKKWTVCLSIIILVLNFVPNLLQGHQVFAENQKNYKDKVELINDESFNISYSMRALENQYEWEIDYRINKTENDKELKLKFSFEGNQPIEIEENESWTLKEKNTIISGFEKEDEGKIVLRANNSISLLNLEIQADAKLIENEQEVISEDILAKNESTIFSLYIPENNKADSKEKDNKNTEEVLNNESSQEETVSQLKKDSQLSFSYPSNFGIKASFNDLAQNYENIYPEYRQDETGISPNHSWIPTGNTTVVNHQGWNSFSSQWDGVNSWNGEATNLENSYIEYAGVNNPVDFALRKYAKETETPGLYDVYLNVRGNVQNPIKPVDIVLVIDMSGSMQGAKETAVRQGVSDFLSTIQNTAYADYVNVGIVGYSSPGNYVTGASGYITVPIDKVSSESHVKSINQALAPQFSGGTFTQLGLRKGTEMLEQDSSDNQKMMILMTDGVPTFSYKVNSASKVDNVIYGQSFAESRDEPGNTSKIQSPYSVKDINGGSNIEIRDTWAATLGEAEISKQKISEIHTLGIQLGNDGSYLSQEEVKSRTSLIATTGLYQDANSANDITDYLKSQANVVLSRFNTITNGLILDPLGAQFEYKDTKFEITSVGEDSIDNLPTGKINEKGLEISNLNIGKNQEVQIHYQVRLNTETDDFKTNYWYQMNGETTLTPNGSNPDNKVNFGVPSAKSSGINLTLEKQWLANSENIPENVELLIGRRSAQISSDWTKTVTLQEGDEWRSQLENLPKYSILGEEFIYEIKDEIVPNSEIYDWITIGEDKTTIANIEKFRLQLIKTSNHDNEPLSEVEFVLKNSQGEEIDKAVTNEKGEILFDKIRLNYGEEYQLHEIKSPGHSLEGPWKIKTELENGQPIIKVDGEQIALDEHYNKFMISLNITNDINVEEFRNSVTIDKRAVDSEEKLDGAVFNLYQIESVDDELTQLNPLEITNNLLPGLYALQESVSPNGYYRDDEVHFFRVKFNGSIVAIGSEGIDIPFLDENESGKNGLVLNEEENGDFHLTLIFYNQAVPPLQLEVDKIDDDFASPLAGVSFELTRLGRKSTDSETVKSINSFDRILKTFNNDFTGETIALKSNSDGKLTVIDNENNTQESTSPISLDYDTQYKLVKKSSIGLFPNFGETSQWIITTPNMDELKEHEEDNNIEIDGGDLLETPDESILESINQTPSTLGVVSLIKTKNPEFKALESPDSQVEKVKSDSSFQEKISAYLISFEIHSNITHSFTIKKVDGESNRPMDTQFALRWVEKFEPTQDFDSLERLNLDTLDLSGNDISTSSKTSIDAKAGATLSTEKGSRTLDHMARGNLYIISEEEVPTGYQKTNTVIVAYMDKAQGYADKATIHIRLAKRSATHPEILEFGSLEYFKEYKGDLEDELGIVFANYKITEGGSEEKEKEKEENNEMQNKQETNKPNIELPALGAIGVGGVGLLLIISAYLLKKYRGK